METNNTSSVTDIESANNKYKWLVGALLVIVIALVIAHSHGNRVKGQIRIGFMSPLTGNSASIGERIKNAANLAVQDLKSRGEDISLIIEDDKGDATTAVSVVNKLIDTDHVHIIIGTAKSDPMLAVAPITERNKVILISPTAGADAISNAGDFVFRNIEIADVHGKATADFFADKSIRTAGILVAQASNAQSYGNAFASNFSKVGTLTATSSYNPTDSDFRTIITKVIDTKPDALYLAIATAKDAGMIVKQARELGYKGTIVASVAAFAPEFFTVAGGAAEGAYVNAPSFNPDVEPAKTYNQRYRAEFGTDSDGFAANSYDAVMLIGAAIVSCDGDTNTECIRDYLYNTKDYPGVSGLTTFDRNGDVVKLVVIKLASSAKFVDVR